MEATAKSIVESYLKANGFDGLYEAGKECACFLGDVAPCNRCFTQDCTAGYAHFFDAKTRRCKDYDEDFCEECKTFSYSEFEGEKGICQFKN